MISLGQPASFYKVFSGTGYDKAEGLTQLEDSSYLITGSSSSFSDGPSQTFLLNIDKNGEYLWSNAYGGEEYEEGKRVFSIPNYGHYIIGTSNSGISHDFDAYVVFTDPAGVQQWEQFFDYGAWERVHNALMFPDSSIVVIGETDSTETGNTDFYMFRMKHDGTVLWTKKWGSSGNDVLKGITAITNTSFAICGTKYIEDSLLNKSYVGTFNLDGTTVWEKIFGEKGSSELNDIHHYNTVLMTVGQLKDIDDENWQYHRLNVLMNGDLFTEENFQGGGSSRFGAFIQYTSTNKLFVLRQLEDPDFPTYADGEDVVLSRYSAFFSWENYDRTYSNLGQDQANQIIATKDGMAAFVGFHSYYAGGGNCLFIVKIGDDSNYPYNSTSPQIYDLVSVLENKNLLEVSAFPNPFNSELKLRLPDNCRAEVKIYNEFGQLIRSFTQENNLVSIATDDLSNGVYFLEVSSDLGNASIKVVK